MSKHEAAIRRIIGEKVYLRPLEERDIEDGWLHWINDPVSNTNLISPWPQTRDGLKDYWAASQPPGSAAFAICEKESDIYIGNARLSSIDLIHRTALYGRLIGREHQGKGLGTEALILLFQYGFHTLGLNRIWSSAWIGNEVSLRSNEKMGMTREGIMRQFVWKAGGFHDVVILAMLREDFDRIHGGPEKWRN